MTLTLVIPGLLWPRQIMRDTLYDAEFPALQTLLGKGRRLPSTCPSADAWWCSLVGIRAKDFASAPQRLSALGGNAGDSMWLCADPVNLHIQPAGATLKDPAVLDINVDEAAQLHATLAPLFAEVGELVLTTPSQWHLRSSATLPSFPQRLQELVGESATALLPLGTEGKLWRQLINDVQITLHQHPVNAARTARGLPSINSVALWGAGRMPAIHCDAPAATQCDDPVIAGLAKHGGHVVSPLSAGFATTSEDLIVHWDKLLNARAEHDAILWREELQRLENNWLAPALAALASGTLRRIDLHGFGDEAPISRSMTSLDRYCFWRKPRRLESQ